ncbi:MAG: hypothetical protein ABWX84_03290 [Nocardioides sp.]
MQNYRPGFDIHHIQAGLAARQPWGWRSGVVATYADGVAAIDYVSEAGTVEVWHTRDLGLAPGSVVRVHEGVHVLDTGQSWWSVDVRAGGLGAVPEPAHPELWAAESQVVVTEVATGRGVTPPVD